MEGIKLTDEITIYNDDFEVAIAEACEDLGIEDLKKEGQRPWKAVMQLVGKKLFPDRKILKDNNIYKLNNNNIPTNNNKYNYILLNELCDYYLVLSNRYNKLVSIIAFGLFININPDVIEIWASDEPSSLSFNIYKKLRLNREDCLKDKNFDSNNVVGSISIGNTEFNWNMPGVSRPFENPKALNVSQLPKLTQNTQSIVQNDETNNNIIDG